LYSRFSRLEVADGHIIGEVANIILPRVGAYECGVGREITNGHVIAKVSNADIRSKR
jgi:hypothetical protein